MVARLIAMVPGQALIDDPRAVRAIVNAVREDAGLPLIPDEDDEFKHTPGGKDHDQSTHGSWSSSRDDGGPRGHDLGDAIDTDTLIDNLQSGQYKGGPVRVSQDAAERMLGIAADEPSFNLQHVQIEGEDNQNLFAKHARELPRSAMPQLPETEEGIADYVRFVTERGHRVAAPVWVDPRELTATQNELDSKKVSIIAKSISAEGRLRPGADTIVVSRDKEVLDGHHRWAASAVASMQCGGCIQAKIIQVDADIDTLLKVSREYSAMAGIANESFDAAGTRFQQKADSRPPCPDPSKPYLYLDGEWHLIATDAQDDALVAEYEAKAAKSRRRGR